MRNSAAAQRNALGIIAVLAAACMSISCGGGAMPVNHTASGTQSAADMTLNASTVDFGSVSVGASKTSSVTVTNSAASGGASLTFSQVMTTGSAFSATANASLPIVLPPGASASITVTFAPKSAGAATGSLSIMEADSASSTVPLSGTGLGAGQLGVSPSTLSFGNVAVGSSLNKTGTLTAGSASVNVSSAAWSGQGYSVSGITFPATIPAGQSVSFTVTFAPQTTGSSPGSISFVSNASNSPSSETFTGNGTQTQGQTPPPTVQHDVQLSWDASTSNITGYYVYRASGGGYARLNSSPLTNTAYTDSTVQSGATYTYVTTAVDSSGEESSYSNQVSATIPTP